MPDTTRVNRLAAEPSLYLQQHASNPVDWYPWGEAAFERARGEGKLILLSVGYSACHWCHVMERESFENERIAALMNERFVCIKVDREERPDIDNLYMKALQAMTGRGGWPMTVFLTPDGKPFYAGTYFPPDDRGGMPGFPRVLDSVFRAFREKPDEIEQSAEKVQSFLAAGGGRSTSVGEPGGAVARREDLDKAAAALLSAMDSRFGGFGEQPKFPSTLCLSFLMGTLRNARAESSAAAGPGLGPDAVAAAESFVDGDVCADAKVDEDTASVACAAAESESYRLCHRQVKTALDAMAGGGIYDHLAGGFHRYAVDRAWLVPHFEKMLYDQALLSLVYTEAWQLYGDPRYREVALGIVDYVAAEMTSPCGAFYSTLDADSEGVEGKFYVWSYREFLEVVGEEDAALAGQVFGVSETGNFEGSNILHRASSPAVVAAASSCSVEEVEAALSRATTRLLAARGKRVRPVRDEKTLADWSGLMISAAAVAGRVFGREDLVALASAAADFCRSEMMHGGRLLHFYADGAARVGAFLDDYAFLGRGCLDLFLASGRREDLQFSEFCAHEILNSFLDQQRGVFFFNTAGPGALALRSSDLFDSAVPSGNSVAVELLLRLHQFNPSAGFEAAALRALAASLPSALGNPFGAGHFLSVAQRHLRGYSTLVVCPGKAGGEQLGNIALRHHCPELSVLELRSAEVGEWPASLASGKIPLDGKNTAYLCRGSTCEAPVNSSSGLLDLLAEG